MSRHFSHRFVTYLALALVSCVMAAVVRRIELVMVALPFLGALVLAMLAEKTPAVRFTHSVSRTSLFEGDQLDVVLSLHAQTALPVVEVVDPLPVGARLAAGRNSHVFCMALADTRRVAYQVTIERRSRFTLGRLAHRVHQASGLIFWEGEWSQPKLCVAYPRQDVVSRPVRPFHTQVNVGNYASREASEGLEFASLRQYTPGDRLRAINWRLSQRSGRLHVNQYTRERNTDVVLLIDTFEDAGPFGDSVLDRCTRLAASLCEHFLQGNNRVGFIEFSGIMKWVSPNLGRRQHYRILEQLTDVRVRESDVGRDITRVPRQILPPEALIIAFTPLVDERFSRTLLNLASRRYDIAAVLVNPALPLRRVMSGSPVGRAASAIWRLETELSSDQLAAAGVPILSLGDDEPVDLLAARLDSLRTRRGVAR